MSRKIATREKFKSLRMRLSREEVLAKSAQIQKQLFELPEFTRAKTLAFYVAKQASREVETEQMIKDSLLMGKHVLVPIVDKAARKVLFSELRDYDSELALGAFGILEPKPSCRRLISAHESDLIIVPGVAFDLRGHRFGYGGGYFDKLLREVASTKPSLPFVGLAFELQVTDKLPNTWRDVAMDILVTEKRVLNFKSNKLRPIMSKYAETGVDVRKRGIETFKVTVQNLFPQAFCVVGKDPQLRGYGVLLHTDGAGSKPLQNYLHWNETGEFKWFESIAQDVVAMNVDDIICVGAQPVGFVDYVAINAFRVPKKEFLDALNFGFKKCLGMLKRHGIKILFLGGETADLPDQLRTLDVSGTISARVKLSKVINGSKIKPGDVIVGLRSGGKTKYETHENSGIMCNGITLARHSLMQCECERKYPELKNPGGKGYYGRFAFDEYLDELGMTVGEAILSPTRIFAPVIARILERHGGQITGLVHNTGGGQTKCLKLGKNIHYIKEDLVEPDSIFRLIQREAKVSWREMFEDFNMGVGFEVIVRKRSAEAILAAAERFGLGAKVIGRCEKSDGKNKLTIRSEFGKFEYR